jgi:hypothetical protein
MAGVLASRHSIICSLSIVWRYNNPMQFPIQPRHMYEWLSMWFGLVTWFIDHSWLHFTYHWHTQTSVLRCRFLATDFKTGTITVSLNYTPNITHEVFRHSRNFNWAFL